MRENRGDRALDDLPSRGGGSAASRFFARAFDLPTARALRPIDRFCAVGHPARAPVERVVRSFLEGHRAALCERRPVELAAALGELALEWRGFAYEGAGFGLALVDSVAPVRLQRFWNFVHGAGAPHAYMLIVGAGWATARLPRPIGGRVMRFLEKDPLLAWLAWDGRGFHDGFFSAPRVHGKKLRPREAGGYAGRAYDQGLGRSLWFVEAGDRLRIPGAIERFGPERRADLWSGVGLACAYAGGESDETITVLYSGCGAHRPHFAQGVAFAAAARQRAGNPSSETQRACVIAWQGSDADVAEIVAEAFAEAAGSTRGAAAEPRYERWRALVREQHVRRLSGAVPDGEKVAHASRR